MYLKLTQINRLEPMNTYLKKPAAHSHSLYIHLANITTLITSQ